MREDTIYISRKFTERLTPLVTGMASWCVRSSFFHGLSSNPCGHQTAEPRLGITVRLR